MVLFINFDLSIDKSKLPLKRALTQDKMVAHHAKAFLVTCMDFRFINDEISHMLDKGYEFTLGLFQTDKTLAQYIPILIKYGCLANAIKHGLGNSFDKLKCNYNEFLYPPTEYNETVIINGEKTEVLSVDAPYVLEKHIDEFYITAKNFWQNIPEKLVIDFTEKIPKRVIKA